jgi:DNA-binding FrmR family transcriptional regulator
MAQPDPKLLSRLSRIEGQVRGVARMLEEERYCIEVLDQVQAIKAALKKVEAQILKTHADSCVAHAIESGDAEDQRRKFTELVDLLGRYGR